MKVNVIKIGGNVVEDRASLESFIADFAQLAAPAILVHGGGVMASQMLTNLGIEPKMLEGRRVTDEETLRIVTMVYAGWCNKSIVALLQKHGRNALGLSGADGNVIKAVKRPLIESTDKDGNKVTLDYGYAGDIINVNADLLTNMLTQGITPVICSITHDCNGTLLNTNADTIASATAIAMSSCCDEVNLTYCFEKNGVLYDRDDENSVIGSLNPSEYAELKAEGRVAAGMIPKLDNAFRALDQGVARVEIKNASNILNAIGTVLTTK